MSRRTRPIADRARAFIDDYTRDLTARDLQRVFTRETRDMVSFSAADICSRPVADNPPAISLAIASITAV